MYAGRWLTKLVPMLSCRSFFFLCALSADDFCCFENDGSLFILTVVTVGVGELVEVLEGFECTEVIKTAGDFLCIAKFNEDVCTLLCIAHCLGAPDLVALVRF